MKTEEFLRQINMNNERSYKKDYLIRLSFMVAWFVVCVCAGDAMNAFAMSFVIFVFSVESAVFTADMNRVREYLVERGIVSRSINDKGEIVYKWE